MNGKYLEKSQYLALICEPSVDAHLLHLRNKNLAFVIIMMELVMMLKIDKNKTRDDLYDYSDDGHGDYEDLEEAHYSLQRQLGLPLSDPF